MHDDNPYTPPAEAQSAAVSEPEPNLLGRGWRVGLIIGVLSGVVFAPVMFVAGGLMSGILAFFGIIGGCILIGTLTALFSRK